MTQTSTAPQIVEPEPGVLAYVQPDGGWCVNNAGILVGDDLTVVVDTAATRRRAEALKTAAEQAAARPVGLVVNTHFHGDHVFGNSVFAPGTPVVAQERTRDEIVESGLGLQTLWPDVEWGDVELRAPDVTFRDRMTLHLGAVGSAELIHVGRPAHTPHDSVVWLSGPRVLFAGDLVWSGVTPFCLMGSVTGSIDVLRQLAELRPATVVPGHGPVGGPELIGSTLEYLEWVHGVAGTARADGLSALDAARRAGTDRFAGWLDSERIVGNLARAMADAEGAPGGPLDVVAAMGAMVEFRGGPLPSSA
jgi:cyclase